jgi:hypothetical protein
LEKARIEKQRDRIINQNTEIEDSIHLLFMKPPDQMMAKVLNEIFGKDIINDEVNHLKEINELYEKHGMMNINLLQKDGIVKV